MSIVNSIEIVREWLDSTVCPMVQLKLPDDSATDASYPYKPVSYTHLTATASRTPAKAAEHTEASQHPRTKKTRHAASQRPPRPRSAAEGTRCV